MQQKIKNWILFVLYTLALLLIGFFIRSRIAPSPAARLSLADTTVQRSSDPIHTVTYSPGDLGGAWDGYIGMFQLDAVNLSIGGKSVPLDLALKARETTVEALIAQAFADARTGVCTRADWEDKGLSRFDFRYDNFDMTVTQDVCKTPTREKITVQDVAFYPAGTAAAQGIGQYLYDKDGSLIDRYAEDWGLTIQAAAVTSSAVILDITQKKGQQIGTIVADHYSLLGKDGTSQGPEKICTAEEFGPLLTLDAPITLNGKTQLTIDWSAAYGSLPAGEYTLALTFRDDFTQQDLHPLMEDYEDQTRLFVPFTVK